MIRKYVLTMVIAIADTVDRWANQDISSYSRKAKEWSEKVYSADVIREHYNQILRR